MAAVVSNNGPFFVVDEHKGQKRRVFLATTIVSITEKKGQDFTVELPSGLGYIVPFTGDMDQVLSAWKEAVFCCQGKAPARLQ